MRVVGDKNRPESDDTATRFSVLDLSECCIVVSSLNILMLPEHFMQTDSDSIER